MILPQINDISPTLLTVITLITYELGNKKLKKTTLPITIALIITFLILATIRIYTMGAN